MNVIKCISTIVSEQTRLENTYCGKNDHRTPPSKGDLNENDNLDGSSNGHEPGEHYKLFTFEINTIILHIFGD